MEGAHQQSQAGDQDRHVLSFKKNLPSHSQAVLPFVFCFFLTSFICCLLIRMIASQASRVVFQKKSSNHCIRKHCSLSIPLFFYLLSCLLIRMVDSRASCFLLKNFFRRIHEHCCSLSLFCFSDTFSFLVNGSRSHDKLSAPYGSSVNIGYYSQSVKHQYFRGKTHTPIQSLNKI